MSLLQHKLLNDCMRNPILEYGSTVWDPQCNGLNDELENVQKHAARFVTRNYSYETCSMTGIREELKWETLHKRRKDNRLILLYKGQKDKARIPTDAVLDTQNFASCLFHYILHSYVALEGKIKHLLKGKI